MLVGNSVGLAMVGGVASAQTLSAPPAQAGVNLLTNPGHEYPGSYYAGRGELNTSWNWIPFWQESPAGVDARDQYYRTPEFRPAVAHDYPYRVNSGGGSNHWFNYFALNKNAGVLQEVDGLTIGQAVRFSSWVELWSSNDNDTLHVPALSTNDGNMQIRVCIDQDGGPRNMLDTEMKCSPWYQPYDKWVQVSVDGVAKAAKVAVLIHTRASIPVEHNDAFGDDSCFEVLPAAGAPGICLGRGFIPTGATTGVAQVSPTPPLARVDSRDVTVLQVNASTAVPAPSASPVQAPVPAAPPAPAAAPVNTGKVAVANVPVLNVRNGPGTSFQIVSTLAAGQSLAWQQDYNADWRTVTAPGIGIAYLSAALSSVLDQTAPVAAPVAAPAPIAAATDVAAPSGDKPRLAGNVAAGLNIREVPGLAGSIVGVLPRGEVADVLGKSADGLWYQISYNGITGHVYGALTVPNTAAR